MVVSLFAGIRGPSLCSGAFVSVSLAFRQGVPSSSSHPFTESEYCVSYIDLFLLLLTHELDISHRIPSRQISSSKRWILEIVLL